MQRVNNASSAMFRNFITDQSGATAIEYGLIVTVLSLAIVAGVANFSNSLNNLFDDTTGILDSN